MDSDNTPKDELQGVIDLFDEDLSRYTVAYKLSSNLRNAAVVALTESYGKAGGPPTREEFLDAAGAAYDSITKSISDHHVRARLKRAAETTTKEWLDQKHKADLSQHSEEVPAITGEPNDQKP